MQKAEIEAEALELFRALLRIDTTNPPGNERAAAELLAGVLRKEGYDPRLIEELPGRANLVVRRKGDGSKRPLMLTAHLDVVPAEASRWTHPPFAAEIHDGWLYGRGAIDMKNMVAMSAMVMLLLEREKVSLKRDVIFSAVADEEVGCTHGSKFLVEHHPDQVNAEYSLGEIGGFTLRTGGKVVYPVQVAQKGVFWLKLRAKGTPGHGSIPREDNAVLTLARALMRIGNSPLPVHPTEPMREMIAGLAKVQGFPASLVLPMLLRPMLTDFVLENLISDKSVARTFNALLRNTATPTVLRAGGKTNVIPGSAEVELDGRLLPGQTPEHFLAELEAVVDDDRIEVETISHHEPLAVSSDTELFRALGEAVKEMDPEGVVVPNMIPGYTDAGYFSKLGTICYGFAPTWFPEQPRVAFTELYHAHDERIPVEGFFKGLWGLYAAVKRFCG